MATLSITRVASNKATIASADVNTPFSEIETVVNALTDTNISSTAAINHGKILGGIRFSNRQDDTTNNTVSNQRASIGWGYKVGTGTSKINEAVTFAITYTDVPIIFANLAGVNTASNPTTAGDVTAAGSDSASAQATQSSTTGMTVYMKEIEDTWSATDRVMYHWWAVGTLAN